MQKEKDNKVCKLTNQKYKTTLKGKGERMKKATMNQKNDKYRKTQMYVKKQRSAPIHDITKNDTIDESYETMGSHENDKKR